MSPKSGPGLVTFVGAGPGDPELLTLRGKAAIEQADLVLYAGSLVSSAALAFVRPGAAVYDSAYLTLEESHALVREAAFAGGATARVHTGDPSIYSALAEQITLLDRDGIPWRIVPGVTAAMAAAAEAGVSFSIPEVAQSLIITRLGGRTPMPANEDLATLASHGTSMAIYLAGKNSETLQAELLKSLAPDTVIICISRASWPDQRVVECRLDTLARVVREHGMGKQTVFLVLPAYDKAREYRSRLYHGAFGHEYRKGMNDG